MLAPLDNSCDKPWQCIKKQRLILPTKVCTVKANVFQVVMYGCESWTIKKAECWRLMLLNCGAGEERLLRVPWTARRSNQSILREIGPGCSLEGLMLKLNILATWCEYLTHLKRPWCWGRLKAEGEGDNKGPPSQSYGFSSSHVWMWELDHKESWVLKS